MHRSPVSTGCWIRWTYRVHWTCTLVHWPKSLAHPSPSYTHSLPIPSNTFLYYPILYTTGPSLSSGTHYTLAHSSILLHFPHGPHGMAAALVHCQPQLVVWDGFCHCIMWSFTICPSDPLMSWKEKVTGHLAIWACMWNLARERWWISHHAWCDTDVESDIHVQGAFTPLNAMS